MGGIEEAIRLPARKPGTTSEGAAMSTGPGRSSGEGGTRGRAPQPQGPEDSALTKFLKATRSLLTPEEVGLPAHEGRGRRAAGPSEKKHGLSQRQAGKLANMDESTYGALERGERKPTAAQLDAIAEALFREPKGEVDPVRRDRLYVLALGKYPTMKPGTTRPRDTHLHEFVRSIDATEDRGEKGVILKPLLFATDPFFNIVAYNKGFADLFVGDPPANALTWGLLGGDGQLLEHDLYLLNEARFRVEVMRGTHENDPRFHEIDELFKSLPPSDIPSARPAIGLRETIFPFKHPQYQDGSIRSSETHITGEGGVTDGSSFFVMSYYENVTPGELR
ncbi:helix-turn-helix domain-containing protein [Streptomyces niveus]|uniref:helix-turn-helix domain-containing protein n=1 Tax=Streptomyces niveus TaxID=193462 RepID=UPI003656C4D8